MADNIKIDDNKYISNTYARNDLLIVSGNGLHAFDENGNKYLDFTSGIGVNSLGFCNEKWVDAIAQQAGKLQHTSNLYYTEPCVQLAKKLCVRTKAKCVFFSNSGAEANEGAIKLARKYSFDKYGQGRHKILSLNNSFHGRTLATLKATGQSGFHVNYGPFPEGFEYAPANDIDAFDKIVCGQTGFCAIIIEMVQGEGGVVTLENDFAKHVANWCEENDVLLIVDEVQTGIGRTGTFLALEQFCVKPDIITLAKGLGGGLPIGAILMLEKVSATFKAGDHGSTYGANPVVCAGANVVVDTVSDDFLLEVQEKGKLLKEKLQELPHVKNVSGMGLMLGISFDECIDNKTILKLCMDDGLLCLTAKDKLRLLPPLTVNKQEIETAVKIIEKALGTYT